MLVVSTPTGQIGRDVLAQLVTAGEPVRAVARDRTRIDRDISAKAEVVELFRKTQAGERRRKRRRCGR
jgi:uncharacterized protein YbjT (DUF2867 family)